MIVFLYGPDSYRRSRNESALLAKYRTEHSALSIGYFDAYDYKDEENESAAWDAVRDFVKNRSLFDDKKLAVFRAREEKVFIKEEIKFLKDFSTRKDAMLFLSTNSAPLQPFAFLLTAPIQSYEFKELSGIPLRNFVQGEARRRGLVISEQGRARLVAEYRGDTWGLMTEMDRLALSSARDFVSSRVTPEDFIGTVKKLAYGHGGSAISALERALHNEDSARLFNVLTGFVSGEKKRLMADYDAKIKFGTLDYESALTDFVLSS